MPVVKVNPARQIGKSIHYITTGNYGKGGVFNQPHSNRGDKDITQRNYLFDGFNCSDNPSIAMHQMDYFIRQKQHIKNHCVNFIIAYGTTFDWRNPNDLALGREFNHKLLNILAPNGIGFSGYQMDTRGKHPSAHTHVTLANVNMDTMKALNHTQYHGTRIIHLSERLVQRFNKKYPWHKLPDFTIKHQRHQPTFFEQQIINRMKPVLKNPNITTESQFTYAMAQHGAIAHFSHTGDVIERTNKHYHQTKYYNHPGLVVKIPGVTYGYIGTYKLAKYNMNYGVYGVENKLHYNAQHLNQTNKYYAQHERDLDSIADMMSGINDNYDSNLDADEQDVLTNVAKQNIDNRLIDNEKQVENKMLSIHELMPKLSNKQVQQFMYKDMNQLVPHMASNDKVKQQQAKHEYNDSLNHAHANSNDRKLIGNENHGLLHLAEIDFNHFNKVVHEKASQVKDWIHDKYEIAKEHTNKVMKSLDAEMKSGMNKVMSKLTKSASPASSSVSSHNQASNSDEEASYHSNESNVVNPNFNDMNNDITTLANPYESVSSNVVSNSSLHNSSETNHVANSNSSTSHVSVSSSGLSKSERASLSLSDAYKTAKYDMSLENKRHSAINSEYVHDYIINGNDGSNASSTNSSSIDWSAYYKSADLDAFKADSKSYNRQYESEANSLTDQEIHDQINEHTSSSASNKAGQSSNVNKVIKLTAPQALNKYKRMAKAQGGLTLDQRNRLNFIRVYNLQDSHKLHTFNASEFKPLDNQASPSSSANHTSMTNSFKSEIIASANHENSVHASIENEESKRLAMTPDKQISISNAMKHKASINSSMTSSASVSGHSNMSPATSYEIDYHKRAKELNQLESKMDNSGSVNPDDIDKEYNLRDAVYTDSKLAKKASLNSVKSNQASQAKSSNGLGTNGIKSMLNSMSQSAMSAHTSALTKYMRRHHGLSPDR